MKEIKRHVVKVVAIIISVIYLVLPIHNEVKSLLHSISHSLEMPNVVMSHNYQKHQVIDYEKSERTAHKHKLIDLLDYVFGADSSEKDSNKPYNLEHKVDKHFSSSNEVETMLVSALTESVNDNYKKRKKETFLKKIKIPPKTTIDYQNLFSCVSVEHLL